MRFSLRFFVSVVVWRAFLLVGLCLGAVGGASAAEKSVDLAKGGEAKAVIVNPGANPVAGPLAEYLKKITGADFAQVASENEIPEGYSAIVLEQLAGPVSGASKALTAQEAYRIKADGKRVKISASNPGALRNGVYGFLEDHLGCRFYTYRREGLKYAGPGREVVPKDPDLSINDVDDLQEPDLANRGVIFWSSAYPWIEKNRGIGLLADDVSGGLYAKHNMYQLIPPETRRNAKPGQEGLFEKYPGIYPMKEDGQRKPDHMMGICGTSPDIAPLLAAGIKRDIERRIKASEKGGTAMNWEIPFSAGQGDGFSPCLDKECRALVQKEESEAAPLIYALNRALEIVQKEYPKARLITFAYFETLSAPKTLKPHPDLWVNVVSSARSQNQAGDQVGPVAGNPANRDYAAAIKDWSKIAPGRVSVWHWDTFRADWPSWYYVGENLRYFRDCGVFAVNPQFCGGPWRNLLAWLYLRLSWDADQDVDALVKQFVTDNYGAKAAPHVLEYFRLARESYEQTLHTPSAVRWSGWTPLLREKYFPESRLKKMEEAMNNALAAAAEDGPDYERALVAESGRSLDLVRIQAIESRNQPWGLVRFDQDGRNWFVAGADAEIPPALQRAKVGIQEDGGSEEGALRLVSTLVASRGGPAFEVDGPMINALVCPDLKGRIVSAKDVKSGKELLSMDGATSGYIDEFAKISAQIWLPASITSDDLKGAAVNVRDWTAIWSEGIPAKSDRLASRLILSPSFYGFDAGRNMEREVISGDKGLSVERAYTGATKAPNRFSTQWALALPDPAIAKVIVRGGGVEQLLDLRYATPGGMTGVQVGERLPGADWMDERFDNVVAASGAEATVIPLDATKSDLLTIELDRGDGIAVSLETPSTGWDAVEIKPIVEKNRLEIRLVGRSLTPLGESVTDLLLPPQRLFTKSVPVVAPDPARQIAAAPAPVKPKIRITGPTTAINEIDGAELIWIPSGKFPRGTAKGSLDEQPLREIELDGYWVYKYPVTVAQYEAFCKAAGREFAPTWGQALKAAPVGEAGRYAVLTNWFDAEAYAKWAGAGLPTEAQWEKAARGTGVREYPWGNEWAPEKTTSMENTIYAFNQGFRPVGSHPEGASPYGVQDMAGGVWEWVNDWYDAEYYAKAPASNPTGPEAGTHKVLRGGTSLYDERFSRTAARFLNPPQSRDWTPIGFRCVVQAPGPEAQKTASHDRAESF